jgi:DNA-binding CsgD family transcriptional regulator
VCHLAAGLSVGDAATRMRVKVDTARAYLKQVFAKTGTHRQASLLQLVTRHQRVIQGDHLFGAT